jgi:hypothetical protein
LLCSPEHIQVFIGELCSSVYLLMHLSFECDIVHLTKYRREDITEAFIEIFSIFVFRYERFHLFSEEHLRKNRSRLCHRKWRIVDWCFLHL